MNNHKIIFTGPVGAGKTTAIQAISDVDTISTNERASDMTKSRKNETTVAMDYGMMQLNDQQRIHLYGTPGQERFSFMWDILSKGGIGLILLLDNSRRNPMNDFKFFTDAFQDFIQSTRLVVGVTRMDITNTPTLREYQQWASNAKLKTPIFEVDARQKSDISTLVESLILAIDPEAYGKQ